MNSSGMSGSSSSDMSGSGMNSRGARADRN
jgi:hypothetical protein